MPDEVARPREVCQAGQLRQPAEIHHYLRIDWPDHEGPIGEVRKVDIHSQPRLRSGTLGQEGQLAQCHQLS